MSLIHRNTLIISTNILMKMEKSLNQEIYLLQGYQAADMFMNGKV